jgi:hypothetical protein
MERFQSEDVFIQGNLQWQSKLIDTIRGFRGNLVECSKLFCGFLLLLFRGLFLWLFFAVFIVTAFAFWLDDFVETLGVFLLEDSVAAEEVNQGSFFLTIEVPFFDVGFVTFEKRFALCLELGDFG